MPAPLSVSEYEAIARERLAPSVYDYYAGGAGSERTIAMNQRSFDHWAFRPRVLAGVETVDTSVMLFGTRLALPVLLAPTAFQKLGHADGEVAAARAAAAAGTAFCLSTMASTSIEDLAAAAHGTRWFQLYIYRDRAVTEDLVRRAEASGYQALVLTVDTPRLGRRERDIRNGFALPPHVRIANLERYGRNAADGWTSEAGFTAYVHRLLDSSLSWESVEWLQSITKLPVIIKGVLAREDAELAIDHGAAGIIVSNHGGRQLDGAIATLDALPAIVEEVDRRIPVLIDGGIRRGTDVLTALALGANAVMIGRPYLFALAADGERGVATVLEMLRSELELAMALAGCSSVERIGRSLVSAVACG